MTTWNTTTFTFHSPESLRTCVDSRLTGWAADALLAQGTPLDDQRSVDKALKAAGFGAGFHLTDRAVRLARHLAKAPR